MKIPRSILAVVLFMFLGMMCILKTEAAEARTGYIYTGDSRMRRLNVTIGMSKQKDTWVYYKSGMGYSWFVNESLEDINNTIEYNKHIDNWVIISGWGVNDLGNIDMYLNKYKELLYNEWSNCNLFLMSVNPVDSIFNAKYAAMTGFNEKIYGFVQKNIIKSGGRIFYLDSNSVMNEKGFFTIDGLHYTEKTNRLIYRTIRLNVNLSGKDGATTINANAKETLKHLGAEKKVKWKSSNPEIVRIVKKYDKYKHKADILAVSPGTATITATSENYVINYVVEVSNDYPLTVYFTYDGNIEEVAEYIQSRVGGDVVCIYSNPLYPLKKKDLENRIKLEYKKDARPEIFLNVRTSSKRKLHTLISTDQFDISKYSKVYIGYPIWNNQAPKTIYSFLDKFDVSDKTVDIFYTTYDENVYECELKNEYPNLNINSTMEIAVDDVLNKEMKKQLREWIGN